MLSLNNKASPLYSPGTKVHFLQAFFFSDNRLLSGIYITWLKTLLQPIRCLLWNPKLWLKWWTFPGLQYLHRWLVRTACSPGGKSDFFFFTSTYSLSFPMGSAVSFRLLCESHHQIRGGKRRWSDNPSGRKGFDMDFTCGQFSQLSVLLLCTFMRTLRPSSCAPQEMWGVVAVCARRELVSWLLKWWVTYW